MRISDNSPAPEDSLAPVEDQRFQTLHDDLSYARAIINTVHDALLVLDNELRIQEANRSFFKLFAVAPEDITDRLIYDLWDSDELRRLLENVIPEDNEVQDYYLTYAFPGLGERIMQLNARRFGGRHAKPLILLAMNDVTERQQQHNALAHHASELARSNDDLEQFAFVASHDLQAPLRTIISYLDLLKERYGGELGSDADDFIRFTIESADHLQEMTRDLLRYSQVDEVAGDFKPVDLQDVLDRALADLLPDIESNKATLTNDPLPVVLGHVDQLVLLFRNLIDNAIKFRSEKPPQIHIGVEQRAQEWVISVQDDGIGLGLEHRERIFELFQRVYGRTEFPGSGIGLAIAKKIVQQHGGRIWVESQLGDGAVFYFTFPERLTQ